MSGKLNGFKPSFYLKGYELAAKGIGNRDIAKGLGVSHAQFSKYLATRPAFKEAIVKGRGDQVPSDIEQLTPLQRQMIAALCHTGNVSQAVSLVGMARTNHYDWIKTSEIYAKCVVEAEAIASDMLVAEARRRAQHGVARAKFHNGQPIMIQCQANDSEAMPVERGSGDNRRTVWMKPYIEHEYSDKLLVFLIKRYDPAFRDEKTSTIINAGGDVVLSQLLDATGDGRGNIIDGDFIEAAAQRHLEVNDAG